MNSRDYWTDEQFNSAGPPADPGIPALQPDEGVLAPVDRIAIRKLGGFNFLTPEQWIAMTSDARRKAIEAQDVIFMADGETLPIRDALQYLKWLADQMEKDRMHGPDERAASPTQRLIPQNPHYPPPDARPNRQPPMPPTPTG